jgi:hypothetical protein
MPEQTPAPVTVTRTDLEKLTKAELVDRTLAAEGLAASTRERTAEYLELRPAPGPQDAFLVSALLDLHRAALHARYHADAARYLDAALKVGAPLADAILAAE